MPHDLEHPGRANRCSKVGLAGEHGWVTTPPRAITGPSAADDGSRKPIRLRQPKVCRGDGHGFVIDGEHAHVAHVHGTERAIEQRDLDPACLQGRPPAQPGRVGVTLDWRTA